MRLLANTLLATAALAASIGAAQADIYTGTGPYAVSVTEGLTNGNGFATTSVNPFLASAGNTAGATFAYTGALNFSNTAAQSSTASGDLNSGFGFSASNISGYSATAGYAGTVVSGGTVVANYSTLAGFLASSGSSAGFQWGSLYTFDLGKLAAGTVLTITHDDGASVYQNGVQVGTTAIGPTTAVTDTVQLTSTAETFLQYSRQNGTPSVLRVSVPEPMSLTLLGSALIGLGMLRRKSRKTA